MRHRIADHHGVHDSRQWQSHAVDQRDTEAGKQAPRLHESGDGEQVFAECSEDGFQGESILAAWPGLTGQRVASSPPAIRVHAAGYRSPRPATPWPPVGVQEDSAPANSRGYRTPHD